MIRSRASGEHRQRIEREADRRLDVAGHHPARREIRPDDPGAGIARRDSTIETVEPLLKKQMGGFRELSRMLSYEPDLPHLAWEATHL